MPAGKPSSAPGSASDEAPAGATPAAPRKLPDDPQQLKAIIAEQDRLIRHLYTSLSNLQRRPWSNRSEKIAQSMGQLLLSFGEALEPAETEDPSAPQGEPAKPPRQPRKGKGRRKLPANLERRRIVYDEPKTCPCCAKPLRVIGEEVSEQLEREPAKLYVIEHVRLTFAPCDSCPSGKAERRAGMAEATSGTTMAGLPVTATPVAPTPTSASPVPTTPVAPTGPTTAPVPPKPISKGIPGPKLMAWILTRKYRYHLPIYRVHQMLEQEGALLVYQTIVGWVAQCAFLLRPIWECLKEVVLQSDVLHSDDTAVRNIKTDRVETGYGRLWPYVGDSAHPVVVFQYTTSRKRDGPAGFLEGWQGKLQADAWSGYDRLYASGGVVEVACWAHARRKFTPLLETQGRRAAIAIGFIRCLFRIEARAKKLALPAADVVALRQRKSKVVLERLRAHLEQIKRELTPEHVLVKAANYVTNQWQALCEFLTDAALDIDNNEAERTIRAIAVGRKNWMFVVGDEAGPNAAVLYSIVATCLRNGIDPEQYLAEVLPLLATLPANRAVELTPLAWHAQRQAVAAARTTAEPPPATASATPATSAAR